MPVASGTGPKAGPQTPGCLRPLRAARQPGTQPMPARLPLQAASCLWVTSPPSSPTTRPTWRCWRSPSTSTGAPDRAACCHRAWLSGQRSADPDCSRAWLTQMRRGGRRRRVSLPGPWRRGVDVERSCATCRYHHGRRWTDKFAHVVGVMHTNYLDYARREDGGHVKEAMLRWGLGGWEGGPA